MAQPPTESETASRVIEVVAATAAELHPGRSPGAQTTLDSSLERDLAFDSLGRVELFQRLEQAFGVTLPERILLEAETPRDLLRAVLGAGTTAAAASQTVVDGIILEAVEATPDGATTLIEVLDWHVRTHPERPHIRLYSDHDEGRVITYGDLRQGAERVAAALRRHELGPGEAVAIMLPTGADYFFAFFGALLAGGIPVPMYPPARMSQIEEHLRRHVRILDNCLAAILITEAETERAAGLLKLQVPGLRHVLTVDAVSAPVSSFAAAAPGAGDTAFLQYTSGSTGNPKGVVLSHANLLANIRAMGAALEVTPADVFVSWLPLYHDMGLIGAWLGSLHYAMPLVLMSPLAFLARPQRWLQAIHRYRGTLSAGPNFAYELCLRRMEDGEIENLDLGSWRMACNGAEPVSPDTVERFCQRFAAAGFRRTTMMPMFGLAENCVGLAFPPLDRGPLIERIERRPFMDSGRAVPAAEGALRMVACGRPLPGHEFRVVDAAGRELPERRQGRLQFRGPSSTSGYFRNAEATRELFRGEWLESGDYAYIAGGDVFIAGRAKDLIIRAGRNIYPAELEDAVGELEGIRKSHVAVFGSSDAATGTERLIVLAETRRRDPAAQEALRARINELAVDLIEAPPDEVVLAPPNTVLKTSSGKIRRAASRQVFETGLVGKRRRAVWWQVARLALSALMPQARRAASVAAAATYGVWAWALLLPVALVGWLLVAVLPPPAWRWAVARAVLSVLRHGLRLPLSVQGLENLPPPGRPCVFVCNHSSYIDGPVVVKALPGQFSFVAKAELLGNFVPRIFLRRIGSEFVERFDKAAGLDDARRLADLARGGRPLFFFAEGTFRRMPGLLPFQLGAFVTAAEEGLPVVPVILRGTRSILREKSAFARPGPISVIIDTPIEPEDTGDTWKTAIALRDATRARILHHCGEPDLGHERPFMRVYEE